LIIRIHAMESIRRKARTKRKINRYPIIQAFIYTIHRQQAMAHLQRASCVKRSSTFSHFYFVGFGIWYYITYLQRITRNLTKYLIHFGYYLCRRKALSTRWSFYFTNSTRTELGFYQALRKVIVSPHEVPEVFLSRVDTVAVDHLKRENQRRIEEMMVERSACDDNAGLSFRERSGWDDNAGLSFREGSEEQDPTDAITPASIPSSFESLKTHSICWLLQGTIRNFFVHAWW